MPRMGNGYWLNPNNDKCLQVTTHDAWIQNAQNAAAIGLPDYVYQDIAKLQPQDQDEIRMLAIHAGLVRIRDYGNYTAVQFAADPQRVPTILWSILVTLKGELKMHPYTDLKIDNLKMKDSVTINIADLQSRLENDQPVLRSESIEGIHDIPFDHPATERMRLRFKEYLERNG